MTNHCLHWNMFLRRYCLSVAVYVFLLTVKGSLCLFTEYRLNKLFTIHHVQSIVYVIIDNIKLLHRVLWNMNQFLFIVHQKVVFCFWGSVIELITYFDNWILCNFFSLGPSPSIFDMWLKNDYTLSDSFFFFYCGDDLISLNIWKKKTCLSHIMHCSLFLLRTVVRCAVDYALCSVHLSLWAVSCLCSMFSV